MAEDFGAIFDSQTAARLIRMLVAWESSPRFNGPDLPEGEALLCYVEIRQGILDGDLDPGGSATVSLYKNGTSDSWIDDVDTDSNADWERCFATYAITHTLPAGTKVIVIAINDDRFIVDYDRSTLIKNFELKTDLAGSYGSSCTAYEIDEDGDRIEDSEFLLYCGPANHEGDGSTESGADGSAEGTGHTGSAVWKNDRWETQSMSCSVKVSL